MLLRYVRSARLHPLPAVPVTVGRGLVGTANTWPLEWHSAAVGCADRGRDADVMLFSPRRARPVRGAVRPPLPGIDNRQCLTTPVKGDTSCHLVIDAVAAKAQQLIADMASKGVAHLVYFFYPHIDTTTIYSGPDANDWLDYAYPQAARACCAAGAPPPGAPDLTCHGSPAAGLDCTFIDTRPELAGHNDPTSPSTYWFDIFGIHPNQQGADLIAGKVWKQMQKYCVAQ
jgi:hypothetical protein